MTIGRVALVALALSGCAGGQDAANSVPAGVATGFVPIPAPQAGPISAPGNVWSSSCITLRAQPHLEARLCMAELRLGVPGVGQSGMMYSFNGGRRWAFALNTPVTGVLVQVEGRPELYQAQCRHAQLCLIEAEAAGLTQAMLASSHLVVTMIGQQGQTRQRSATGGLDQVMRTALAGTTPGLPVDRPPGEGAPSQPPGRAVGRPLSF